LAGRDGKGCCPGQTGHHALPEAMFDGCPGYDHDAAPTICVEGTNNNHGSHGTAHNKLEDELNKIGFPDGAQITKEKAIQAGAKSVNAAFPESGCDVRCIESQLHAYYDKLNCMPKSASGKSTGNKQGGKAGSQSKSSKKGR
ncbi:HNH/endonuclease VII fold toxin-2 domain-containing protein, partial [Paracidovorax cattleyae]